MVTLHPTAKQTRAGYVPMVNIRQRGKMAGSKTGNAVFHNRSIAESVATFRAIVFALDYSPDQVRVA